MEQQVLAAATDIDAFYRHKVAAPATAEMLLVLSVDGKGLAGTTTIRQASATGSDGADGPGHRAGHPPAR